MFPVEGSQGEYAWFRLMGAIPLRSCYIRQIINRQFSMKTAHLEAEILKLPRNIRVRLAELLIYSLDEDNEIENAWADEASRRYQAYLNGDETMSPLEDVMEAIRKEFSL